MTRWSMTSALALLLAGCPGGAGGPDATPCALEVQWGQGGAGAFAPFEDGDDAELTVGFQGFRYIISSLRVESQASRVRLWFDVAVEGQEPYASGAAQRPLEAGDDGAGYATGVLVYFNDVPMPQLLGRTVQITAHATDERCAGRYRAAVTVVDEEDCVEGPDGEIECTTADAGP